MTLRRTALQKAAIAGKTAGLRRSASLGADARGAASEESSAGSFTVADIYRRLPHGYIGKAEITGPVKNLCQRQVLGIHPRAARNGAHRYGFREQP